MTENSTALTTKQDALPANFEELNGLANAFVKSGMFSDTKQLSQAIVKIQAGRELGLPPVYSMQNINMIRNRLCSSANTLAMLVKKSGHYNYRIKEHNDRLCSITFFEREGDKWIEVGVSTFTIEDAKRADLVKPDSGWVKYPRALLFARSISQGARIYCPDAIGGMYTDEEIRSIPPKPDDSSPLDETEPPDEGQQPTGEPVAQPGGKVEDRPRRDPASLKTIKVALEACNEDFGLSSKQMFSMLKVQGQQEIIDTPSNLYIKIRDWGKEGQ